MELNQQIPMIHFDLTIEETNLIIRALNELPYKEVCMMINKIIQTSQSQLDKFNVEKKENI